MRGMDWKRVMDYVHYSEAKYEWHSVYAVPVGRFAFVWASTFAYPNPSKDEMRD